MAVPCRTGRGPESNAHAKQLRGRCALRLGGPERRVGQGGRESEGRDEAARARWPGGPSQRGTGAGQTTQGPARRAAGTAGRRRGEGGPQAAGEEAAAGGRQPPRGAPGGSRSGRRQPRSGHGTRGDRERRSRAGGARRGHAEPSDPLSAATGSRQTRRAGGTPPHWGQHRSARHAQPRGKRRRGAGALPVGRAAPSNRSSSGRGPRLGGSGARELLQATCPAARPARRRACRKRKKEDSEADQAGVNRRAVAEAVRGPAAAAPG